MEFDEYVIQLAKIGLGIIALVMFYCLMSDVHAILVAVTK